MKSTEFIATLKSIAKDYKTLYVLGGFGAPLNAKNKARYTDNNDFNRKSDRTKKINAASEDTFAFDCSGLIKGVLWGWDGDLNATYGGAKYRGNDIPDMNANGMIKKCTEVSTDFNNIVPGELVWIEGHIGVYIGDGLAVECTYRWKDGVQITACNCTKLGYNRRNWTKHGKFPYIEYVEEKWTPAVGDTVYYNGTVHYTNANAATGKPCKSGKAKIQDIYRLGKSKHPYLLKRVLGGGSNVYGWVDEGTFTKI